jgi:hypothetical protein
MSLTFCGSSPASQCFCRVNLRSFLSSPLSVVRKGLELTRNRLVGHGFGTRSNARAVFKYSLPRCEIGGS